MYIQLLYGSYDIPILEFAKDCPRWNRWTNGNVHNFPCYTTYLFNTTWTQGRNQLGQLAIQLEDQRRRFDAWMFVDEDVQLECFDDTRGQRSQRFITKDSEKDAACWAQFLDYLRRIISTSDAITTCPFTTLTVLEYGKMHRTQHANHPNHNLQQWYAGSTPDAMLAAIPRPWVPYLIPYPTLPPGTSEYTSQAVLYCLWQACFPQSVLYAPGMVGWNGRHRDYLRRNMTLEGIVSVVQNNDYQDGQNEGASHWNCSQYEYRRYRGLLGPYDTLEELVKNLPVPPHNDCERLAKRFSNWRLACLAHCQ